MATETIQGQETVQQPAIFEDGVELDEKQRSRIAEKVGHLRLVEAVAGAPPQPPLVEEQKSPQHTPTTRELLGEDFGILRGLRTYLYGSHSSDSVGKRRKQHLPKTRTHTEALLRGLGHTRSDRLLDA
jgi:hypothetical protein